MLALVMATGYGVFFHWLGEAGAVLFPLYLAGVTIMLAAKTALE